MAVEIKLNQEVKGKVKQVQGDGVWNDFYKFEYDFEDGVTLTAFHKTQEPRFKAGEECIYIVTKQNKYGNSGKVDKIQDAPATQGASAGVGNSRGWKPKSIEDLKAEQRVKNPSFALSYAKDFITDLNIEKDDPADVAKTTCMVADVFNIWLNEELEKIK